MQPSAARLYRKQPDYLISVTAAPAALVTLAEAKAHCRVAHDDEDSLIEGYIAAASAMLDGFDGMIGKAIAQQTVRVSFQRTIGDEIELPVFPVQSLSSITYYDAANEQQTFDSANVRLVASEDYARINLVDGAAWPTLFERADAMSINVVCGFATVPAPIKHAALLMIGHWYENREAASEKNMQPIALAVDALVNRYRSGWIAA